MGSRRTCRFLVKLSAACRSLTNLSGYEARPSCWCASPKWLPRLSCAFASSYGGAMTIALTHFAARAGDHNDRAMAASPVLTQVLADTTGADPVVIGEPAPALATGWEEELAAARLDLQLVAQRYEDVFHAGETPVTALSRCAVALATLPVVAAHRDDAAVVWFDAHADLNTPGNTNTGYLGGLAFAGPLGLWDSGLGSGLALHNAVLVGARDLDAPERALVDDGSVRLVRVATDMAEQLRQVIAGRPVYVHIDCDVLAPGTVPTDYLVPGGMTLAQLRECAAVLAESEVVGIEVGELEAVDPSDPSPARLIVEALAPLLDKVARVAATDRR